MDLRRAHPYNWIVVECKSNDQSKTGVATCGTSSPRNAHPQQPGATHRCDYAGRLHNLRAGRCVGPVSFRLEASSGSVRRCGDVDLRDRRGDFVTSKSDAKTSVEHRAPNEFAGVSAFVGALSASWLGRENHGNQIGSHRRNRVQSHIAYFPGTRRPANSFVHPCDNGPVKLLVVEDDPAIAEPLVAGLRHHGFEVEHVGTGQLAIDRVASAAGMDMVLLDLGLPDIDGITVCREIRKVSQVPIIMVTARDDEVDRVVGLELGADDYVSKPFGIRELVARVRAVSRRFEIAKESSVARPTEPEDSEQGPQIEVEQTEAGTEPTELKLGALHIDHRTRRVRLNGVELALTPKEHGVLSVLAVDPGAVVTRMSLIEQVWDEHWYGPTKTLDVHVAQLRQKLGNPGWIETVRSVGYRLVDPDAGEAATKPEPT
jgi:two-component system, OmpR family, response regulator RegX3